MAAAEPESSCIDGIGLQLTLGFRQVSGQKAQSPHCPDIRHNESSGKPYEKGDAVPAEEFATVNVHD